MRKHVSIALLLAASCSAFAISSATFTGGRGGGSGHAEYILQKQPALAFHFFGGSQDGYASSEWRSYQLSAAPALARFRGGVRDGYASGGWRGYQPTVVPALDRFAGAVRDGYASAKFLSSWSQNLPRRFLGGSFDGYDSRAVQGIPNWTTGDTDGNGLPDWWELKYFGVLTGTDPNADPDHDGASNLFEFLTGTNPTNASSYFHITRMAPGSPNKVFVYGEPSYLYTLQRADNLPLGWINVSNQSRISTSSEGELEMDDNFRDSAGFYRVLSEH